MIKIFALMLVAMMVAHVIRPFGLPGLRRRGDFWKIAAFAFAVIMAAALIRPD